jgi:sugar/nucleoside kinase (ribokinase family)
VKAKKRETEHLPLAMGTGLIALDVVVTEGDSSDPLLMAGGTCGNVLLALSYLGFRVAPICRLEDDEAAELIQEEFREWNVDTTYVSVGDDGSTPVIFQTIRPNPGGVPTHSFSWRCPACNKRFPAYKPALASTAEAIAAEMLPPRVFFFDRVNRGSLILAEKASELGALVVFEPSSVGDHGLFKEAWALSHVVKYSHERLADLPDLEFGANQLLQVETLGADGLRYRAKFGKRATSPWRTLEALKAPALIDTAGAGDWCTAGLIHRLGRDGAEGFRAVKPPDVEAALRYGQALAAWNCGFVGARGGMNHMTIEECQEQVVQILAGRVSDAAAPAKAVSAAPGRTWCPACGDPEESSAKPKRRTIA